jgi:WD40 repeat protein
MNQKVWIWSARTGKQIAGPLLGESAPEFSPNGKSFLTISTNGVRLWATDTGEGLPIAFRAEAPIRSAHFSPNGHWIVTACSDKTARVWDATSGKAITEAIRHETEIFDATFSPDSQRVLTVSMDNKSRMWDIHTGQMISQPIPGALHFSPDGQRALVTSVEGVFVWELEAGKAITEALRYENKTTFAPQLSTDGKRIVIGSEDAGVSILDAHNGGLLSEPLRHPGAFTMGEFSPNGHRVVTFSWDETARVWDAFTGRLLFEPLQHEASILSAQFSPDGLRVLTASIDKTAREWDANTGKPLIELRHEASVYSAQFSPDGRWILTLSFDHKARLWDAQTGKPTEVCVSGVSLAQISPDGQWVVTAGRDNTAQVWLVNTGQSVGVPLRHEGEIISVRFSPDSHCIVTASKDKTARVWDTATGELIAGPFRHEGEVFSALFSPDSRWVVTASDDKTARVWDARSGQPLTESLRHEGRVNSAEFSADGTRVVTASDDKTALVWDVNTGERLTEPLLHRGSVLSAQFSPDGQRILTTCSDGAARVWDEGAAQVPVPIWFIEWAEAQAGRRFNSQRLDVAVSTTEQRECRQQVAGRKDTDFFTLVAQWIQADPETRTISPFSPITVADYVNRRVQESTVLSLREAIRLSPTNSLAFARLAELLKDMDPKLSPGCLDEAQFYAEYSLKQDPINAEAWRALAGIQFLRTQTVDALRSVDRAVELKPGSYQSWEAKGNMLEKSGRTSEALEAYSQALQLFRHPAELPSVEVKRVLLSRARVFKTLNRLREAGEDICAAYGVPLRQGTLAPLLLDLSIFYNAGFRGNWHGDLRENDLSELPVGTQRLAGVSFDVRGLIQIGNIPESAKDFPFIQASNVFETNRFPQEILGIPVGRACRSLNFLHAAINAGTETSAKAGEQIGFYRLHYASRQLREIPIVLGKDVTDWWTQNNEPSPSAGGPVVAWTGTNGDSRRENRSIRLFKTHWENPLPDDKIETIDFVSSHLLAAPFLVAITVEQ